MTYNYALVKKLLNSVNKKPPINERLNLMYSYTAGTVLNIINTGFNILLLGNIGEYNLS